MKPYSVPIPLVLKKPIPDLVKFNVKNDFSRLCGLFSGQDSSYWFLLKGVSLPHLQTDRPAMK